MHVLNLKNIQKNDGVIYYRREYSADAEIQVPGAVENLAVTFTIETGPLGNKDLELCFDGGTLNYPVLPVRKALKDFILLKDRDGELPI